MEKSLLRQHSLRGYSKSFLILDEWISVRLKVASSHEPQNSLFRRSAQKTVMIEINQPETDKTTLHWYGVHTCLQQFFPNTNTSLQCQLFTFLSCHVPEGMNWGRYAFSRLSRDVFLKSQRKTKGFDLAIFGRWFCPVSPSLRFVRLIPMVQFRVAIST